MELPAFWVDELFTRLTVRYGVEFLRQYQDLDIAVVKADWGRVLARHSGADIAYALEHLPTDKPPTALQFREQCRLAPRGDKLPRLAMKAEPPPGGVREMLAKLRERILAPKERPGYAVTGEAPSIGTFNPIDPSVWPEAMRKELGK